MPRLPRLSIPGIPQHIVQRGNNRQACFFEREDYTVYLDKLKEYSKVCDVQVHGFVLMTNHVHLLVTPQVSGGESRMMQSLGRYYVRYINQSYKRSGTLWEGRFKSTIIESERYFLTVCRYIELNPVRAKMVEHPSEYPWSSYQGNAEGRPIALLSPHDSYLALGKTDKSRQNAYRALFEETIPKHQMAEIRQSIDRAWVLGDERFIKQIESETGRKAVLGRHGGDRRSERFESER